MNLSIGMDVLKRMPGLPNVIENTLVIFGRCGRSQGGRRGIVYTTLHSQLCKVRLRREDAEAATMKRPATVVEHIDAYFALAKSSTTCWSNPTKGETANIPRKA